MKATANSTYKKLAVQWFTEALCFVSSSVVADPPSLCCGRAGSLVIEIANLFNPQNVMRYPCAIHRLQTDCKKLTLTTKNERRS